MIEIRRATEADAGDIELLRKGINEGESFLASDDAGPICLWGFKAESLLGDRAWLWFYPRRDMQKFSMRFLRANLRYIQDVKKRYPIIGGSVDPEQCGAVRWIEWLGFRTVGEFYVGDRRFLQIELTNGA